MESVLQSQDQANNGRKLMTDEEKNGLLDGLKTNHAELQRTYLGLSVITDTIPKKERKQKIEGMLANLEADIQLLERGSEIWVQV